MNRYDPADRITRAEQASAAAANTIRSIDMTLAIVGTEPPLEAPIYRYARNHWATQIIPGHGFPAAAINPPRRSWMLPNHPARPLKSETLTRMDEMLDALHGMPYIHPPKSGLRMSPAIRERLTEFTARMLARPLDPEADQPTQ